MRARVDLNQEDVVEILARILQERLKRVNYT